MISIQKGGSVKWKVKNLSRKGGKEDIEVR